MEQDFLRHLKPPFYTPDLVELEQAPYHLVMDCGPFKPDVPVFCTAYTVERMSLFIQKDIQLPIPIRLPGCHRARVAGALYAMSAETLVKLDKKRQNRLKFERTLVEVYVPGGDDQLTRLPKPVWLHVGIPDYWAESITWLHKLSFSLAETYIDNISLLNHHFRYSGQKVEDYLPVDRAPEFTWQVADHVARKNKIEILKNRRGLFNKFKRMIA